MKSVGRSSVLTSMQCFTKECMMMIGLSSAHGKAAPCPSSGCGPGLSTLEFIVENGPTNVRWMGVACPSGSYLTIAGTAAKQAIMSASSSNPMLLRPLLDAWGVQFSLCFILFLSCVSYPLMVLSFITCRTSYQLSARVSVWMCVSQVGGGILSRLELQGLLLFYCRVVFDCNFPTRCAFHFHFSLFPTVQYKSPANWVTCNFKITFILCLAVFKWMWRATEGWIRIVRTLKNNLDTTKEGNYSIYLTSLCW